MAIRLGVDTLCWHLRLETGNISPEEVLQEAADVGAVCVQVNLYHVRGLELEELEALGARGRKLGLELLA